MRSAEHRRLRPVAIAALILVGLGIVAVVAWLALVADVGTWLSERTSAELGHVLMLCAGAILAGGILILREGYVAGLWLLSSLIAGLGASLTVVTYLLQPTAAGTDVPLDPVVAVYLGLAGSAVTIAVGGLGIRPLARRERAQIREYHVLVERLGQLRTRVEAVVPPPGGTTAADARRAQVEVALAEARTRIAAAERQLVGPEGREPGLRWALATGYCAVRRDLHRAEEALLVAQSPEAAVGDALHDELSLTRSTIANRADLRGLIRRALVAISPGAAEALLPASPATTPAGGPTLNEAEARETLREVRFAINDFRDDRIAGLVRARNRLIWTLLAVGLTTYLLLALALVSGVSKTHVIAATVFYLVGAIVGMFNRLRIEARRSGAVEDYGLYQVRLVAAPLISGLAAVAGVFLVAQAPAILAGLTGTPIATLEPAGLDSTNPASLSQIYDLTQNQAGLFVAAILGLAPGQLASVLQRQSDRIERDLEASAPAATAATPTEGED